ncbi:MAG: hypothetical protein KDA28_15375, partial [Phycisphaerales bacterium]|nr:hypothetical protein [Phycisphaerales bacterium]
TLAQPELNELDSGWDFQDESSVQTPSPNRFVDPSTVSDTAQKLEGDVSVDEHMIVELHVNDEDLSTVLQTLSIQSQKNIVTSRNVSATVTANLYGVTFYQALDAILHVNGYGYIEKDSFIYVYTLDELVDIAAAAAERVQRVFYLNYLNATDAAEFVRPLLSDGGQIKTNGQAGDFSMPDNAPTGNEEYPLTSMLICFDYAENIEKIETLLAQIDTRPSQVLVEATILQATLNEANAFGMDFSIIADLDFMDFTNPLRPVEALLSGEGSRIDGGSASTVGIPGEDQVGYGLQSNPGNTSGPGTFKAGIVDNDVAVFVRMLDEVTDVNILSKPKILAMNRQPARVLIGRKVGYLQTTSTDTSTTQTVEFLDTGTQLYFRPFVTNDGLIRMELKPQVSEAVIRETTDALGAAVTIPDEITNELVTNILVRDGQTIVLGGLFREATTVLRRQVPVLGDIPILGNAFKGTDDNTERSEIIFMVTPSIVNDDILDAQAERGEEIIEAHRVGARSGLLFWSRERQASQLLVEAERALEKGKKNHAISKVKRALQLKPMMPEAVVFLDRLQNEQTDWPSGSILEQVISDEIGNMIPDDLSTLDEFNVPAVDVEFNDEFASTDETTDENASFDDNAWTEETASNDAQAVDESFDAEFDETFASGEQTASGDDWNEDLNEGLNDAWNNENATDEPAPEDDSTVASSEEPPVDLVDETDDAAEDEFAQGEEPESLSSATTTPRPVEEPVEWAPARSMASKNGARAAEIPLIDNDVAWEETASTNGDLGAADVFLAASPEECFLALDATLDSIWGLARGVHSVFDGQPSYSGAEFDFPE